MPMQTLIRPRSWIRALVFTIVALSAGSEVAVAKCSLDNRGFSCDDGKRTELNVNEAADLSHHLLETKLTPFAKRTNLAYFDLSVDFTDIQQSTLKKMAYGYLTASPEVLFAENKSWWRGALEKYLPHGWFDEFRSDLRSVSLNIELERKDRHETLESKPVVEYKRDPHESGEITQTCFNKEPLYKHVDSSYDLTATFGIAAVMVPQGPKMPAAAALIPSLIPYKAGQIFATVVVFIWQNGKYIGVYFKETPPVLPVSRDILRKHGGLTLEDGQLLYKEPSR
jgi:hypothetical protein